MKKFLLVFIVALLCGASFAGAECLQSLGLPLALCDMLSQNGVYSAILLPITEQETGLVAAYTNKKMIADEVMPIDKLLKPNLEFSWFERTVGDAFLIQETAVGRKSRPNQVYFSGEKKSGLAKAYGLEAPLSNEDLEQLDAAARTKVLDRTLEGLINRVILGREVRVATLVADKNNYLNGQAVDVDSNKRLTVANADVFGMISDMLDNALARPTMLGMNARVWAKLRTHASIISALFPNGNGTGVATRQQIADLFEVDKILVGQAMVSSNKNPKAPITTQCWGNHLFGLHQEELSTLTEGITWGITAQVGERIAESNEDKTIGLKGGVIVKAGFYQDEVVVGKGAGFLLKDITT